MAIIDSINESDGGEYLCYGFPADRSTYTAAAVQVVVNSVRPSRYIEANVNQNIDLNCDLEIKYDDVAKWRKLSGVKLFQIYLLNFLNLLFKSNY